MNVDDVVAEKIAAARQRGLAFRYAAQLCNQTSIRTTNGTAADNPSAANDTLEDP